MPTITADEPELAVRKLKKPLPKAEPGTGDDPADEAEREAAFDGVYEWHGGELLPFSSSRQSLWKQFRVAMGAPDLGKCLEDLDGFHADAMRILFLCSFAPDEPVAPGLPGWGRLRAEPHRLQAAIDEWQDENARAGEAPADVLLAYKIYAASFSNQHEAAPAPHAAGDDLGN